MTNMRVFRILEAVGGVVVFLLASFLHFFYELSGGSVIGALFGSVNESVWEHIKIFSEAYLAYTLVEILWARPPLKKLIPAKAAGLVTLSAGIALSFYAVTALLGKDNFIADIAIGFIFSLLSHFVSYRLTIWEKNKGQYFFSGLFGIILFLVMILCFSFFPPKAELFRDIPQGYYGLPPVISR